MPYAKFDVELYDLFEQVPERHRAGVVSLYVRAVLLSAELLLDGTISGAALASLAPQVGLSPRTEEGRSLPRAVKYLLSTGVASGTKHGGIKLKNWHDHHSSRDEVKTARDAATERKRRSRGQLTLPEVTTKSQRDTGRDSQRDKRRDSRAHARTHPASNALNPPTPLSMNGKINCPECGPLKLPTTVTLDQHRRNVHGIDPDPAYEGTEPA